MRLVQTWKDLGLVDPAARDRRHWQRNRLLCRQRGARRRGTEAPKTNDGDNGAIDFSITPTEGANSVCSTKTTEWRAGTRQFLCCRWDGKEQRLYVNGRLEGTSRQAHPHQGANLVIGSPEFEGTVDEVMKWSRALSESEVAELFRSTGG